MFVLEESLRTQIPVVTCLPPLRERSDLEKRLLLKSFYEEEEQNLRKRIVISSIVYRMLMKYPFEGNLTQLKSCIRVSCANALSPNGEKQGELKMRAEDNQLFAFFSNMLDSYDSYQANEISFHS